jgi:flagellar hook assembly protein FlgD
MSGALITTLVDETTPSGDHQVTWNGQNETGAAVATGYYYYTLDAQPTDVGGKAVNYRQKMLLMK